MTEKRFWLVSLEYDGEQRFVRDNNQIGEKSMSNQEVVDLLNNLTEENEVCKQAYQEVKSDAIRLKNENEQLKSKLFDVKLELEHSKESNDDAHYELTQIKKENDDLKRGILKDIFADECEEYKKENEQLKHQLITLDGLYVSDKEDMSEVWRLDLFSDDTK